MQHLTFDREHSKSSVAILKLSHSSFSFSRASSLFRWSLSDSCLCCISMVRESYKVFSSKSCAMSGGIDTCLTSEAVVKKTQGTCEIKARGDNLTVELNHKTDARFHASPFIFSILSQCKKLHSGNNDLTKHFTHVLKWTKTKPLLSLHELASPGMKNVGCRHQTGKV